MRTYLDCIPCFVRQALEAARHVAPTNEALQRRVLEQVCTEVPHLPETISPPLVAEVIHRIVREESGVDDPYRQAKEENIRRATRLLPRLEAWAEQQDDRFGAAVQVAIAGNVLDLGANPHFDLEAELHRLETETTQSGALEQLRSRVADSEEILYIADNAAEAVFDILLVRQLLPRRVFFATRSRPIIDDVTAETARAIGIDSYATVISSGSPIPGTDLRRVTEPFRRLFDETRVVIAKGQGNFETLSDAGRPIFFLFKVKCPVVAAMAGQAVGQSVIFPGGLEKPLPDGAST